MINQPFILLILNCKKYNFKANKQKQTWLLNLPSNIIYFHVIGSKDLNQDFIFDYEQKILYVKTEDDYLSLPKKVLAAYYAINETFIFNYIFKTDDDQNLVNIKFLESVMNVLDKKVPKIHYGGHIVDVINPYLSQYYKIHPELPHDMIIQTTKYCSGRFYFLSNEAVFSLTNYKKKHLIEKELLEDYAIGYNLPGFLKENMLNLTTEKYFIDFIF